MSGTHAPLRIEIVDPVAEPLVSGRGDVAFTSAQTEAIDDWSDSLSDAWAAAGAHFAPLTRPVGRFVLAAQRLSRALHDRSLQLRFDGNPRRSSSVREHVFVAFDILGGRVADVDGQLVVRRGLSLHFTSAFEPIPGGGAHADAALALRGSWPRLPMTVRVEPWWREQSIVTVELRTHRRVRYPIRYFRSAHAAAQVIASELTHPTGAVVGTGV